MFQVKIINHEKTASAFLSILLFISACSQQKAIQLIGYMDLISDKKNALKLIKNQQKNNVPFTGN